MRRPTPNQPVYTIGIIAEIMGVRPKTLRVYEEKGIVTPSRSEKNRRLYSQNDIDRLFYIHYLTHVRRVNLAGVKVVLNLMEELEPKKKEAILKKAEEEVAAFKGEKKKIFVEGKEEIEKKIIEET